MDKSSNFKDEYNFSTCIIIFEEEQEDLQNLDLFDNGDFSKFYGYVRVILILVNI